ncbi:MAG: ATP-dependent helicase C-terminal domain-containing protein [Limisphaerales bacterium]
MQTSLPIWQIHADIVGALTSGNRLVLVAPTGSGKTTQVPQMLLEAGLANARTDSDRTPGENREGPRVAVHRSENGNMPSLPVQDPTGRRMRDIEAPSEGFVTSAGDHVGQADKVVRAPKKIVVLQPRRVAARSVAARVAWERGVKLGAEVGYQVRFDDRTSLGTRICFVTEGILLRWLQDDPVLADVAIVLFDEFHERNLLSDAALALAKQLQQNRRPDLKLAVMSATLDAAPIAEYLGGCPVLVSEGQNFPVEVRYLDQRDERPVTEQAADAVERIVSSGAEGDILVFMPGMGEINATLNACRVIQSRERLALIPLHGDLPPEDQDLAFAPNPLRKVVVATNVAETSVTIDGVRHVVDSGQARIARYDAERGIGTLFVEEISRASAEQRKGRAGRTAPGTCYRLWTESSQLNRPERNTPEIQRADLAEVVLLLHSLHIRQAAAFDWLDSPDPQAVERAEKLLRTLGALDETTGELTPVGRRMLRLPMHPRYSRLMVEAAQRGCVAAAALCAALVSGRDLLVRLRREDKHIAEARELFEASQESDFFTLMRAYQFARKNNFNVETCRRYGIHAQTARQVEQTFEQIRQIVEKQKLGADVRGRASDGREGVSPSSEPADCDTQSLPKRTADHDTQSLPKRTEDRDTRSLPHAVPADDALLRCVMAGFVDQLCVRRDQGTLECELTEGRTGTLVRESVVQNSTLFVAAGIREVPARGSGNVTLLGLASAVKREWLEEMFPTQLTAKVEHLFDRTHKRVAAVRLVRFQDLVIHHEHQRDVDPAAAGRCLAEAWLKEWFELPLFNHEVQQFIARVNLVCAALPELEFPPLDEAAVTDCLARAFTGMTLAKEAQATPLIETVRAHLAKEQLGWLDELAPTTVVWPDGRKLKLLYPEVPLAKPDHSDSGGHGSREPGASSPALRAPSPPLSADERAGERRRSSSGLHRIDVQPNAPELQVKLHDCFALKAHPLLCEGKLPVKLWLCAPDGKRLESTSDWPAFKAQQYPRLRPTLQKKYPGVAWV